jgi:hypothetical protein
MASAAMTVLTAPGTWAAVPGFQAADFVRNTATPPVDIAGDGFMWFLRTVVVRVTVV